MKVLFKSNIILLGLFIALLPACNKENNELTEEMQKTTSLIQIDELDLQAILQDNPEVVDMASIPPATMELIDYSKNAGKTGQRSVSCPEALSPATLEATLMVGESVSEAKTACLEGPPPKGDVLFCFDLTGSMGGILNNVKVNSVNIMNAVSASIPDSHFGLITHKDYPGSFSSCGYSTTYGGGSDFPYALNQSLTASTAAVQAAIAPLSVGGGMDGPESYARALFESYSDAGIGWRTGAARIVVAFLDNIPHDCNLNTGWDPGRDGAVNTADDIDMEDVIAEFAAQNIKLIVVSGSGGGTLTVWNNYASPTGGQAVLLGAGNIATTIATLIEESVSTISSLTLEAESGYEPWLTSVAPASYGPIELTPEVAQTFNFDIDITVPAGTPDGVYEFDVNLVGDDAVYGSQTVTITVISDSDGDGCLDPDDPHPNSNPDATVIIDGCDSGVPNLFVSEDGCSNMSDLIADCAAGASNHGEFVSCVAALTNAWKNAGLITGQQKGAIQSCAAQSNLP